MVYPEIKVLKNNPELKGFAEMIPNVVFSAANGVEVKMTILRPWIAADRQDVRYPLVVFLQGSAWTFPNINSQLPQMGQLAREGYVVAMITHRNSLEGHPFPAYLEDAKTAIRFLRAHAAEYNIDPERVGMYGTSSGGNTALMVGLTGDDPRFKTAEYTEYSDAVKLVVDCFGPADLPAMLDIEKGEGLGELVVKLMGSRTPAELGYDMSPVNYIEKDKKYPPFLLLHGDADELVPYDQSIEMFHALVDGGADARMVRVIGAPHEGNFWSLELVDEIRGFIKENI